MLTQKQLVLPGEEQMTIFDIEDTSEDHGKQTTFGRLHESPIRKASQSSQNVISEAYPNLQKILTELKLLRGQVMDLQMDN